MFGMNDIPKAYYPPRARWYSPVFYFGCQLRRHLRLDRLKLSSGINGCRVLLGLLVPGYAFAAYGRRTLARAVYGSYLLAVAVFVVGLGYFLSSVALAAMISLHVSGVIFLIGRESLTMDLRWRVVSSLTAFSLVCLGIYHPLQRQFEKRLAMPLKVGNKVVLVSTRQAAAVVKRGDWVAYRINEAAGDHMYVAGGLGFGQVQAVAGDRLVFTPRSWQVNDKVFPRRTYMPVHETWVVPEKHWFIWPDSAISISGDQRQNEAVSRLMREVAMVSEPQYVGKPLRRWFWRRQTLP
jgi:hypothetical protein